MSWRRRPVVGGEVEPLTRIGYGKPRHLLSEAEWAAIDSDVIYAHRDEDWMATDMGGRALPGEQIAAGMHEAFAGLPRRAGD